MEKALEAWKNRERREGKQDKLILSFGKHLDNIGFLRK